MARQGVGDGGKVVPPARDTGARPNSSDTDIDLDALLARLDPDQRSAVTAPNGPVVVVAGAGSGKTRVLTSRIAYRIASGTARPANIVAFTFTRQAAAELERRLFSLGLDRRAHGSVVAGTFHSVAYRILRRRWTDRGRTALPTLATSRVAVLSEQLDGDRRLAVIAATEIDWARARLVPPGDYARRAIDAGRRPAVDHERIATIYTSFEQYKRKRRLIDFDDLLSECIAELSRPATAAAVSWWHRHLHVDEFQDINPLQHAFLEALRHRNDDLFVVGDPAQAIYGWNGADPSLLEHLQNGPLRPITVVLPTNYRSTPQVVAAGDLVLSSNKQNADHRAHRASGEPVVTVQCGDDDREAAEIVRLARTMRDPSAPWASVAVLARTHDTLQRLAQAFADARIPTRLVTRQRGTGTTAAALLAAARSAPDADSLHSTALDLLLPDIEPEQDDVEVDVDVERFPEQNPIETGTNRPATVRVDDSPEAPPTNGTGLAESVRTALDAVRAFEAAGGGDGRAFAAWLELNEVGGATGDAVELVTMHAAKGREWPCVIVAAVDTVGFPTPPPNRRGARAEEARLLYVALTRAADRLAVTWTTRRNGKKASRSPLLPSLEDTAATRGAVRAEPPPRPEPSTPAHDPRADALARLRAWRATNARASGLPENFLLDDATLARIADAAPGSEAELASVPGVGAAVARRFADRIIAALTADAGSPRAST